MSDQKALRCEVKLEIKDDSIDINIQMTQFPDGITSRLKANHLDFIRAMQNSIINFIGGRIDRVDVKGMVASDKMISEEELVALRNMVRETDSTLN